MKISPVMSSKWEPITLQVNGIKPIFARGVDGIEDWLLAGRQCIAYMSDITGTASALLPFRRVTTATRGYSNGGYFFKNG